MPMKMARFPLRDSYVVSCVTQLIIRDTRYKLIMPTSPRAAVTQPVHAWTFLSNYAHVLIVLAGQPDLRLRDVATRVGITERAVQRIVADLIADGFLSATRVGRCNSYTVQMKARLRHPIEAHRTIADLIALGN